jgi:hypothetical protein
MTFAAADLLCIAGYLGDVSLAMSYCDAANASSELIALAQPYGRITAQAVHAFTARPIGVSRRDNSTRPCRGRECRVELASL